MTNNGNVKNKGIKNKKKPWGPGAKEKKRRGGKEIPKRGIEKFFDFYM